MISSVACFIEHAGHRSRELASLCQACVHYAFVGRGRPYQSSNELDAKSGPLCGRVTAHDQSSFSFVEGLHCRHGAPSRSSHPARDRLPPSFATSRHLDRPSLAAQLFDRVANCADFHRSRHDQIPSKLNCAITMGRENFQVIKNLIAASFGCGRTRG